MDGGGVGRSTHRHCYGRGGWVCGCCRACLSRTAAVRTLLMHGYRKPQRLCQRALRCGLQCTTAQLSRLSFWPPQGFKFVHSVGDGQLSIQIGEREEAGIPSIAGPLSASAPALEPCQALVLPHMVRGTACENIHMPCSCRQLQLLGVRRTRRRALRPRLDAGQPRRHQHHGAALRVRRGGPAGGHLSLVSGERQRCSR